MPGLTLELHRKTAEGETLERWTVMAADDDGAYIEHATLDESGAVTGEPALQRSGWIELRDHATFKADRSRREAVTRVTALGELDGWLYTVDDADTGTLSEFFFAPLVSRGSDLGPRHQGRRAGHGTESAGSAYSLVER